MGHRSAEGILVPALVRHTGTAVIVPSESDSTRVSVTEEVVRGFGSLSAAGRL